MDYDRYERDVEEATNFVKWLESFSLERVLFEWSESSFRIVFGGFDPLSPEGSLGHGGRFNIGGAQIHPSFPNYPMQGMLYAASTRRCAYKETGELLGPHKLYVLYPKKPSLWDLHSLLAPYPDLKMKIDSTPVDAA